jgi:type III restriction enzyme
MIDPNMGKRADEADDADAYDLILKKKERLLSFEEPVRFIFSHSALREGWDNPNVFNICTLKHSESTITKRQEVGRGMRLCVNQSGDRIDAPAVVHQINVLTVIASESYKDFADGLQREMVDALSSRPRKADTAYFEGKVLVTLDDQRIPVTHEMAKQISHYLIRNNYTDIDDKITSTYHEARQQGTLPPLPPELEPHREQIIQLIDSVFTDAKLPSIENDRNAKVNALNANFQKEEWKQLWNRINRKAVYAVDFESAELIDKCVAIFNSPEGFKVQKLTYTVEQAEQNGEMQYDDLIQKRGFNLREHYTDRLSQTVHSNVKYDLIGRLSEHTGLTRKTIAEILKRMSAAIFHEFRVNPEDFIRKVALTINEQKATMVIQHLTYEPINETYDTSIFTVGNRTDQSKVLAVCKHIYDYVYADSTNELTFAQQLDTSNDVAVYGKLPKGFAIPTPVGDYNPDWAISFKQGHVRHIYFVAETKGSMSSLQLREIEKAKIDCAAKFFTKITSSEVAYHVVNNYANLIELVT